MQEPVATVRINEKESTSTSEYVVDFLVSQNKECAYLDFKATIPLASDSEFPKIAKHIFAFANYGGGWFLVGWKENKAKRIYEPIGLPDEYGMDQATLQEKFNAYSSEKLAIEYKEFKREINGLEKQFAIIFVPPSKTIISPIKDGKYKLGTKEKIVFKKDEVFYRRGSQSINPSQLERQQIVERLKDTNYKHSILSGTPDKIKETLSSNLFPITKFPEYVYVAKKLSYDRVTTKILLKNASIFPEWIPKFREHKGDIVIFEDLENTSNPYRQLIDPLTIRRERTESWLQDSDKRKIIVSLLYKEFLHHAFSKGLYLFGKKGLRDKFYFNCEADKESRTVNWTTRYGSNQARQVAKKSYANQLGQYVYYHHCFTPTFLEIQPGKFYLRITPSFIITENGTKALSSFQAGTFITRLQYKQYNSLYMNNILFWIEKLSENKILKIAPYLCISADCMQVNVEKGILSDIPVSEIKNQMEEFEVTEDVSTG